LIIWGDVCIVISYFIGNKKLGFKIYYDTMAFSNSPKRLPAILKNKIEEE